MRLKGSLLGAITVMRLRTDSRLEVAEPARPAMAH